MRALFTKRQKRICADHTPCAIRRKHTLRVQSMPRSTAAPLYRGERRRTPRVSNPVQAWPALLRISANHRINHLLARESDMIPASQSDASKCVDALAACGGGLGGGSS